VNDSRHRDLRDARLAPDRRRGRDLPPRPVGRRRCRLQSHAPLLAGPHGGCHRPRVDRSSWRPTTRTDRPLGVPLRRVGRFISTALRGDANGPLAPGPLRARELPRIRTTGSRRRRVLRNVHPRATSIPLVATRTSTTWIVRTPRRMTSCSRSAPASRWTTPTACASTATAYFTRRGDGRLFPASSRLSVTRGHRRARARRPTERLPKFPRGFASDTAYLRHLAEAGLARRFEVTPDLRTRLDYELETIAGLGLFVLPRDFIAFARSRSASAWDRGAAPWRARSSLRAQHHGRGSMRFSCSSTLPEPRRVTCRHHLD
jgi:hypothetical protein